MAPSLPAPVARVIDAINAGDTDAFVAAFTPDGRVDDWGRILEGADGIRSWAATDAIGQSARMTVTEASSDGDVTHIRFGWESNRFNGDSEAYVTVADDRVAELRIPAHRD